MKTYTPTTNDVLVCITYGSHLYGTSGPTSDFDFKAVSMPSHRDLMLAKQLKVERFKFDEQGLPIGGGRSTPPNGYEAEHTPVQKFVRDYLSGQAYAVEIVYAVLQGAHEAHLPQPETMESRRAHHFVGLCRNLQQNFQHKNVNGMVGFAVKQTFDYVRRGERLLAAREVNEKIQTMLSLLSSTGLQPRLDTPLSFMRDDVLIETTVLDELALQTGLTIGSSINNNKLQRTLELNGRAYLETTALSHLSIAVSKLIGQYGERSTLAAEVDVDWKSMSHAVRVYQQVLELLETGWITFPRPNADALAAIKNGLVPIEVVKDLLRDLDDQVMTAVEASTLPEVDDSFRERTDETLFQWLLRCPTHDDL